MKNSRITLFGLAKAGKTELLRRMLHHPSIAGAVEGSYIFNSSYVGTIGTDFTCASTTLANQDTPINLILWDTGGNPVYKSVNKQALTNPIVALYCIDLSKPLSAKDLEEVKKDIARFRAINEQAKKQPKLILVGTKNDELNDAAKAQFDALYSELGFDGQIITSAKDNTGIDELFNAVIASVSTPVPVANSAAAANPAPAINPPIDAMDAAIKQVTERSNGQAENLISNLNALKAEINDLPQANKDLIGQASLTLVEHLYSDNPAVAHDVAIKNFTNSCSIALENSYSKVKPAVIGVAVAVLVTLVAATLGFAVGFAFGLWSGPGAFFSGIIAGGAASAVAATSLGLGTGLGFFAGVKHQRGQNAEKNYIEDAVAKVADEVSDPFQISAD